MNTIKSVTSLANVSPVRAKLWCSDPSLGIGCYFLKLRPLKWVSTDSGIQWPLIDVWVKFLTPWIDKKKGNLVGNVVEVVEGYHDRWKVFLYEFGAVLGSDVNLSKLLLRKFGGDAFILGPVSDMRIILTFWWSVNIANCSLNCNDMYKLLQKNFAYTNANCLYSLFINFSNAKERAWTFHKHMSEKNSWTPSYCHGYLSSSSWSELKRALAIKLASVGCCGFSREIKGIKMSGLLKWDPLVPIVISILSIVKGFVTNF